MNKEKDSGNVALSRSVGGGESAGAQSDSVIVPRSELVKLEEARKRVHALFPSANVGDTVRLNMALDGVWELANRKWPSAAPQQPSAVNEAERDARDAAKYRAINTPEIHDFIVAVEREALHQRERWAADHDAGKADADWFWLIGYLAGKALHKPEKRLHHIITTAAACLNWHAAALGAHNAMRPGIAEPEASAPAPHEGTPDAGSAAMPITTTRSPYEFGTDD